MNVSSDVLVSLIEHGLSVHKLGLTYNGKEKDEKKKNLLLFFFKISPSLLAVMHFAYLCITQKREFLKVRDGLVIKDIRGGLLPFQHNEIIKHRLNKLRYVKDILRLCKAYKTVSPKSFQEHNFILASFNHFSTFSDFLLRDCYIDRCVVTHEFNPESIGAIAACYEKRKQVDMYLTPKYSFNYKSIYSIFDAIYVDEEFSKEFSEKGAKVNKIKVIKKPIKVLENYKGAKAIVTLSSFYNMTNVELKNWVKDKLTPFLDRLSGLEFKRIDIKPHPNDLRCSDYLKELSNFGLSTGHVNPDDYDFCFAGFTSAGVDFINKGVPSIFCEEIDNYKTKTKDEIIDMFGYFFCKEIPPETFKIKAFFNEK